MELGSVSSNVSNLLLDSTTIDSYSSAGFVDAATAGHSCGAETCTIGLRPHAISRQSNAIDGHIAFDAIFSADRTGSITAPERSCYGWTCALARIDLKWQIRRARPFGVRFTIATANGGKRSFAATGRIFDAFFRCRTARAVICRRTDEIESHRAFRRIDTRFVGGARTAGIRTAGARRCASITAGNDYNGASEESAQDKKYMSHTDDDITVEVRRASNSSNTLMHFHACLWPFLLPTWALSSFILRPDSRRLTVRIFHCKGMTENLPTWTACH